MSNAASRLLLHLVKVGDGDEKVARWSTFKFEVLCSGRPFNLVSSGSWKREHLFSLLGLEDSLLFLDGLQAEKTWNVFA